MQALRSRALINNTATASQQRHSTGNTARDSNAHMICDLVVSSELFQQSNQVYTLGLPLAVLVLPFERQIPHAPVERSPLLLQCEIKATYITGLKM